MLWSTSQKDMIKLELSSGYEWDRIYIHEKEPFTEQKGCQVHVHNSCYGKFLYYFNLLSFEQRHQTCEMFVCGH